MRYLIALIMFLTVLAYAVGYTKISVELADSELPGVAFELADRYNIDKSLPFKDQIELGLKNYIEELSNDSEQRKASEKFRKLRDEADKKQKSKKLFKED